MSPLFEEKMDELRSLCGKYSVRKLELFGSAAEEGRFRPEASDLDFLVEFLPLEPGQHADAYFDLLFALEDLFDRPVDLVMTEAIRNPYFRESIERSRKQLYAA